MAPKTKRDMVKKAFLEALRRSFGNISKACEAVGITRNTYYRWMKQQRFRQEVEQVMDSLVDHAESMLWKQMAEGNITAIIFFLKCKGKHRGWVERQEIAHGGIEGGEPIRLGSAEVKAILANPDARRAIEVLEKVLSETNKAS